MRDDCRHDAREYQYQARTGGIRFADLSPSARLLQKIRRRERHLAKLRQWERDDKFSGVVFAPEEVIAFLEGLQ